MFINLLCKIVISYYKAKTTFKNLVASLAWGDCRFCIGMRIVISFVIGAGFGRLSQMFV